MQCKLFELYISWPHHRNFIPKPVANMSDVWLYVPYRTLPKAKTWQCMLLTPDTYFFSHQEKEVKGSAILDYFPMLITSAA